MTSCKLGLLGLLIGAMLAPLNYGQEVDSEFAAAKAKWVEIEKQLKQQEQLISSGDRSGETEFRKLVDQANSLIGELRTAGLNALKLDPRNREVIRTLMGIMVNDADFGRDTEVTRLGDELIAIGINPRYFEVAAETDRLDISAREIFEELGIRQQEAVVDDLPRVKLTTTQGEVVLELFENEAPNTVANFLTLVDSGYYDGILFHRVIEDFMAQGGCPDGTGSGGPGYTISCECYEPDARRHFTGSLSMAKQTARDTGGSQFFLTFKRTSMLDGKHTVFGRVLSGWDVLYELTRTHISQGGRDIPIPGVTKDKIVKAEVVRKRDHEYQVRKVGEPFDDKQKEPSTQPPTRPENSESETSDDQVESNKANANDDKGGGEQASEKGPGGQDSEQSEEGDDGN